MINKKQFIEVCGLLNYIIKSKYSNSITIAIPWMHVIRNHPIIIARYERIYKKNYPKYYTYFKYFIKIIITIFKSFLNIKNLHVIGKKEELKIDYLFISHFINKNQLNQNFDLYFNDIPNRLENNGRRVAIASILGLKNIKYSKLKNNKNKIPNYYFTKTLSPVFELKIIFNLIKESIRLKKISKSFNDIKNIIFDMASIEAISPATHQNLRLSYQIKFLVKLLKPKFIVCTYEGHAYERIIFSAAKKISSKIKCISYQHTGVFEMSNAIKIKLSEKYNPNYILTSGNYGKDDLIKCNNLNGIDILKFGSKRGAIKFNSSFKNDKSNYCLVIPEVFISECNVLFNFSISYVKQFSDVKFIFRLHPGISFENLVKKNKNLKNISDNIILSDDTLENDITKSKWVLYRGSSAVFKAISGGLRPIYYDDKKSMSIDPLFKLKSFKKKINSTKHLHKIFSYDIKSDFKESINKIDSLINFCNNQFSEIDMNCFDIIERNENY